MHRVRHSAANLQRENKIESFQKSESCFLSLFICQHIKYAIPIYLVISNERKKLCRPIITPMNTYINGSTYWRLIPKALFNMEIDGNGTANGFNDGLFKTNTHSAHVNGIMSNSKRNRIFEFEQSAFCFYPLTNFNCAVGVACSIGTYLNTMSIWRHSFFKAFFSVLTIFSLIDPWTNQHLNFVHQVKRVLHS